MSKPTVVLLAVLLTVPSNCLRQNETRLSEIVTFVAEVVTKLNAQWSGTVDCWFYTPLADPQPDTLLEQIIQHPALRQTARSIFKQEWPPVYYHLPILVVMDMRAIQQNTDEFLSLRYRLPMTTRILAFVTASGFYEMLSVWRVFAAGALLNVLFIRTDIRQNFHGIPRYVNRTIYEEEFRSSLAEMFPDHLRNINGHRIEASMLASSNRAMIYKGGKPIGPTIDWLRITAQYVNATFSVTRVRCSTGKECSQRRHMTDDGDYYDLHLDPLPILGGSQFEFYSVRSIMPTTEGVIAPRGRHLKVTELFLAPFRTVVWITIVALLVTCLLLGQVFPNHFRNELVMLVLCSFERTALYRVKGLEKTVAITLIIFFFFLISAYESLFISLMTSQPRAPNPRTLDDLLASDIKIDIPLATTSIAQLELHPLIRNVSRARTDTLDGVSAYMEKRDMLAVILKHPINFDYELGQSKYVMLEWSSWLSLEYFIFSNLNPLIHKFDFTQTVLEESGLFRKLEDQFEYLYFGAAGRHHQILLRRFTSSDVVLNLDNLRPAWLVLAVGLLVSALGWIAEWGWFLGSKLYRKVAESGRRWVTILKIFHPT